MKKILALAMALVIFSLAGATANAATYPKLKLRLGTSGTEQGVDAITANHFAKLVNEASGGNISITVFPNSQLAGGSMAKNVEMLITGGVFQLGVFSGSVLGNVDGKLFTHMLPFIFDSYDAASKMVDTTGGAYYAKLLDEKGIVYMSGLHNGLRQLTNRNLDISDPSQLKGLKIRVPSGEVQMRTLAAFGADPVAMNWSETFTALQQGTIDGHENGYQTIFSANIHEVQKHFTEWNWCYDGYWFVASKADWKKFDAATQTLLMEKSKEAALWGRKYLEDVEVKLKKDFREKYGVTITELTPEQHAKFVEIVKPVQAYFIDKFGEEATSAWGLKK